MKDSHNITNGTVIAAMDISKDSFTGYLRCSHNGAERPVRRYAITKDDLQRFYAEAYEFAQKHGCPRIILGFESTGVYHVPMMHYFRHKPVQMQQVNTLHVKRMKDITDNSPAKTDEKDPKVIADLIELRRGMQVVIPSGLFLAMRATIHARERIIEHHTAISNQVSDLVHMIFPEFHRVFKDIHGRTARLLLRKYPLPCQVVALGLEKLSAIMATTSRGRYGYEQARRLRGFAQTTLGVTEGAKQYVEEIDHLISLCEILEKTTLRHEERAETFIQARSAAT
jgi:transposase